MITLAEWAAMLERSLATLPAQLEIGLDKVGELAETLAVSYIGHEQESWPPLAESTLRDKEAKGFPVPSPLLRTGEMRDSIRRELDPIALEVIVGSSDPRALWQEMGTSRIPPRPFLALGMQHALPFAVETFGNIMVKTIIGAKR
jgi:hypothetical protein